jgi:hypothetical protein
MTYEINPRLVRRMAQDYDAAVAPLAGFDVTTVNVSGDTFGDIELAAWFSACAQQFDLAGASLHDGTRTVAENLRITAHAAEQTDDHVARSFAPPSGLADLLDPTRPVAPDPGPYGGF